MSRATLDIAPTDLETPDARRRAVARLAGAMLWPNDPGRWAAWERAALAVARQVAISAGENVGVDLVAHGAALLSAGQMLMEAQSRAQDCAQAGRIFGDCLRSNGEAGFGVLDQEHGLPPMNLTQAKLHHARPIGPPHPNSTFPRKLARAHESLAGVDKRVWAHRAPLVHFCAAHLTVQLDQAFKPERFPCPENQLRPFLRTAEVIRRAAMRVRLPNGEVLRGRDSLVLLPAPTLHAVRERADDEFLPAHAANYETAFPCSLRPPLMVA